jgi:outer membrane protein OmpA-like peptidoglycan-associated protein
MLERHQHVAPTAGMFPGWSADLNPYGVRFLDNLARHTRHAKSVTCFGYTAYVSGPLDSSLIYLLALVRAENACNYLKQHGLATKQVITPLGARNPILPNTDDQNRARNRRVEVTITHG